MLENIMGYSEKNAISAASKIMAKHGIEFPLPWDGSLDDLERERFKALVDACRKYLDMMP